MKRLILVLLTVASVLTLGDTLSGQNGSERTPPNQEKPKTDRNKADSGKAKSATSKTEKKVVLTDKQWRKILTREQFRVLRRKGTEKPFKNKYDHHFEPGTYACAACGQELFASNTKFNSGCGWPAFHATMAGNRVILKPDFSMHMARTEVTCARCGSHLGHIFRDAPQTPTGNRFCINSVSLKFIPAKTKMDSDKKSTAKSGNQKTKNKK